ncbi:hypothetical protein GALMADRAFT_1324316 [Galerina marginata CBS 339.88]|uniref:Pentatricopeptide repeat-containing protein-mitochondrial domain-containing protein n=1 Tax=Galerina marginata (strain CBS 339.88) TaxID=685588 RepID=A0A067U266_GALM3|nr:hypothetical protein GALMADRAFT_1324316 [Galerina marginata CBS 339.88]
MLRVKLQRAFTCTRMNVVARAIRRSVGTRLVRSPAYHAGVTAATPYGLFASALSTIPSSSTTNRFRDLAEALKSSKDLASIHLSCSALAAEVNNSHASLPASLSSSDDDRLLFILHLLAVSGRSEDWRRIEEILRDLRPVLGMKPSSHLYSSMLLRLASEGHHQRALELLLKMPQLPGHFTPDLDQVHLVLETCVETSELQFMQDFVASMRRMGQRPTTKTFTILFRAYGRLAARNDIIPSIDQLSTLIGEYVRQGLAFEPTVADVLYEIYADIGRLDQAKEIRSIYESVSSSPPDKSSTVLPAQRGRPFDPTRSILRSSKSYSEMEKVTQRLGVQCSVDHYTIVMNNCIRSGNFGEAFHIYAKSKEAGITPDSALIAPLLRVLGQEGSERAIDRATSIYREFADAHPFLHSTTPGRKTLNDHSSGPDAAIYDRLFRMLLSSSNFGKCLPVVESLLDEMKDRGLPMDTNSVGTVQILLEMRRTQNFAQAMDLYREYRNQLNEHGFHAILQEYCRISFVGDLEVPLITQYFSIVNDMRLRRVPITSKVYTIILHHIGVTATKIKQTSFNANDSRRAFQRLVSTTRRVHDYLTLDPSISPDAILWNQLMNTYQRLDCFGDACRLWEMMYLTGRFDQVSVNIMLDACAYANHLAMAQSILTKLRKTGFALDLRNWNTWIECLCRNGKFAAAMEVVCVEMGKNGMEPDVESIKLLSKFARRDNISSDFLLQIERSLPQLWECLPKEIRNP